MDPEFVNMNAEMLFHPVEDSMQIRAYAAKGVDDE